MPTDTASQTIEVPVGLRRVLTTLRDVGSQAQWVPEIRESEVLEEDDGLPVTARFTAATPVGSDEYVLRYAHSDDGLSWSMVSGRLQTGQEGRYTLEPLGRSTTRVTFELTIHHHLPLPGFVRGRVVRGLVSSTLGGLTERLTTTAR
ncbi:MAG TPA: SRPBCC family protein [Actinomycetales bacterium]|nr:SRPBCC family protein [Actinomycetales bacterium]